MNANAVRIRSARSVAWTWPALCAAAWLGACHEHEVAAATCSPDAAVELYTRRIEPILQDDQPKSCNQCHLAGIDLSLFVKSTPCQTMACMKQLGLVNFEQPEQSTVLSWVGRAKPQSELITAAVIAKEHDGLLEWIRYSASCGSQACATFDDPCETNAADAATCDVLTAVGGGYVDPGDCRELTLEQLFSADVYRWRDRCFPCHFSSDQQVAAPKWITDTNGPATNAGLACASGSLNTMRTVLSRGYVNLTEPSQSLLLLKPLSSEGGGVQHGGGAKFAGPDDPTYQTMLAWITRYRVCTLTDPTLPKAAQPPPTAAASDAGAAVSIFDYCNCLLAHCHDQAHAKWGAADEAVLAGCRAEAVALPTNRASSSSGNSLQCRATYCEQATMAGDACSAALGETVCL